jgi:hypothetical protein
MFVISRSRGNNGRAAPPPEIVAIDPKRYLCFRVRCGAACVVAAQALLRADLLENPTGLERTKLKPKQRFRAILRGSELYPFLLRRNSGERPGRKSEVFEHWLIGQREQTTRRRHCTARTMQRNPPVIDSIGEATITKPHLGEGAEIGGDDDIDLSARRSFKANLNIVGSQNQPPIPRAAAGFRNAAEVERMTKPCTGTSAGQI